VSADVLAADDTAKSSFPAPRLQSGSRSVGRPHSIALQKCHACRRRRGSSPPTATCALRRGRSIQEPHPHRIPLNRPPSVTRWRSNAMIPDHERRSAQGIRGKPRTAHNPFVVRGHPERTRRAIASMRALAAVTPRANPASLPGESWAILARELRLAAQGRPAVSPTHT